MKGDSSDDEDGEDIQYQAPGLAGGGEKVVEGGDIEGGFGEKLGKGGGGGVGEGGRSEYRGGDYYEFIARAPSIR